MTWSGLARPMGKNTEVGSSCGDGGSARTGATSAGVGRSAGLEVLVVGELEPLVARLEDRHGGDVLFTPHRDHVVAGDEAPERVPLRGHFGIGGRPARQHGDDRRVVVAGDEMARAHGGIVEVRRHDDDAGEGIGLDLTPGRLGERVVTTGSYGDVVDLTGDVVAEGGHAARR